MALRQYRPDYHPYEKHSPKEKQATYHTYQAKNPHQERLKEVLFFVNIMIFSILTVIATYIYLCMKLPAFVAFLLAIVTGGIGLRLVQIGLKTYFTKLKQKKKQ